MRRTCANQKGVVLVVVLTLLTMASLIAVNSMVHATVDERIAGNQKQVADAFLAAEAGLLHAAAWWRSSSAGARHDVTYWNDPETALNALQALDRTPRPGLQWSIRELQFEGDEVLITSRGEVVGQGAVREVAARYRRPTAPGLTGLAPIILGGPIAEFLVPDAGAFRIPNHQEDAPGPAILTATDADAETLRAGLNLEQMEAIAGNIQAATADEGLHGVTVLQALFEAILQSPEVSDGPWPLDLGSAAMPAVNVVRGAHGGRTDLHLTGKVSGSGILIVTGDLSFEQPPDFTGLILVLGGVLEIGDGDIGRIRGSVLVHGIEDTTAEVWTPAQTGTRFRLAGPAAFERDPVSLDLVWDLLPAGARDLLQNLDGFQQPLEAARLFGWFESPRL